MGLNFINPNGFRFFIISNAIALLMLSMVKSIIDLLPRIELLRFLCINGLGLLLFTSSIYLGKSVYDPKKMWFINGFTLAGLILIVYSSSMEIQGAMHEVAIPVVHILEVILVIWLANRMIRNDEMERYTELTHFPSSKAATKA